MAARSGMCSVKLTPIGVGSRISSPPSCFESAVTKRVPSRLLAVGSKAGIAKGLTDVCFTPESGRLDSSGCGGSQRNMQREIDANWSRQSRQFAAQLF